MARIRNPYVYAGPPLGAKEKVRAQDGYTWKSGQLARRDSGVWMPVKTNGTTAHGLFSDSQASATSSSDVWVERIMSTQTQFAMLACYGDSDYTTKRAVVGEGRGVTVSSNCCAVDVTDDTNALVVIQARLCDKEPFKNDSTDSPGTFVVTVKAAGLEN